MDETYESAPLHLRMTQFVPHAGALGLQLVSVGEGRGVMSVAWRDELVGDPDTQVLASGVVTALIDHTCGLAINSAFSTPAQIATLDLRIDWLRAAAPRTGVTAEAYCYKTTRSIGFVRADAWDAERGDLIATAQAAFMLNPRG